MKTFSRNFGGTPTLKDVTKLLFENRPDTILYNSLSLGTKKLLRTKLNIKKKKKFKMSDKKKKKWTYIYIGETMIRL